MDIRMRPLPLLRNGDTVERMAFEKCYERPTTLSKPADAGLVFV
jgi:hypothetical protein